MSATIPDIKLIGLAAAIVLNHPLVFEDTQGAFLTGCDPQTGLSGLEETQISENCGGTIAFIQMDDKGQYFAKVDGTPILLEGEEKFYKALLTAVKQCGSDIVTEEEARTLRLAISDFVQRNADMLALKWPGEMPRSGDKPEHTVIDMPVFDEDITSDANPNAKEMGAWRTFLQRHIWNVETVVTRNLISVGVPTTAREYARRSVLPALFENLPMAARTTAGGVAAALPIVLQLAGVVRDIRAGTQTPESLRARIANIMLVAGTGAALTATGGLSAAANALIAAIFVYVPLRDFSQYFLLLQDNNDSSAKLGPTALSAAAYTGNQIAVDQGMEMLASALEPSMGALTANMVGRALINIGGETLDELTYRGLHAYSSSNPGLEFDLRFRARDKMTRETALDQVLNTLTGRASLFGAAFSGAYAAPIQGLLNSMVVGAILGAGYVPFIYGHAQKRTGDDHHREDEKLPSLQSVLCESTLVKGRSDTENLTASQVAGGQELIVTALGRAGGTGDVDIAASGLSSRAVAINAGAIHMTAEHKNNDYKGDENSGGSSWRQTRDHTSPAAGSFIEGETDVNLSAGRIAVTGSDISSNGTIALQVDQELRTYM